MPNIPATVEMSVPLSCNNTEKLCRAQCQVICLPKPASSHHLPRTLLAPSAVGNLNIKPVFRSPKICLAIECRGKSSCSPVFFELSEPVHPFLYSPRSVVLHQPTKIQYTKKI